MKTISTKLILLLLIFNLISCKKENNTSSISEYQYADQPQTINCSNSDSKLLNEALYTFKNDIANYYDSQQKNMVRAYNAFTRAAVSNKKPAYEEFVSEHSVNVAKALNDTGIFNIEGLNYDHDIIKCIGKNMSAGGIETTFKALLSKNSMRVSLFEPALGGKASSMEKDSYLGLYVALEYFYSKINKIDFSQVDFKKRDEENATRAKQAEEIKKANQVNPIQPKNSKVDFNKRPR